MSAIPLSELTTGPTWQENFMVLLPMITSRAQARFRGLPRSRRADAVQEAVVAALTNYQLLASRGQLHVAYPGTLADFALRHVNEGRHVGGRQDTAKDVLSPTAQDRHSLIVRRYDEQEPEPGAEWQDLAIAEHHRDSVAEVACFRIDFARWLRTLSRRDRKIIRRLLGGERAGEIAERFGVSRARVSQMRRRYEKHWARFQGEEEPAMAACNPSSRNSRQRPGRPTRSPAAAFVRLDIRGKTWNWRSHERCRLDRHFDPRVDVRRLLGYQPGEEQPKGAAGRSAWNGEVEDVG